MFDKIISHIDHYRGPAQGLGTEHGDSWPTAVDKINKGFEAVVKWIEGFDPDAKAKASDAPLTAEELQRLASLDWVAQNFVSFTTLDERLAAAVQPLQDQITSLRMEIESANASLEIYRQFFDSAPQPATATMEPADPNVPVEQPTEESGKMPPPNEAGSA